ncbi:hypothetical protein [Ornithinimicrobium pekingense]|uniref:hypothetical protein n=1 Tax=Ornithinimicrobium pekingense TaxID=384677 RepID=UPI0003B3125F|nr:hypothetical protein [Ornithinimicrobium pekingense]
MIIAGLAALATAASAFSIWSVGRPHPSLMDGTKATSVAGPTDAPPATTVAQEAGATAVPEATTETEAPADTAEPERSSIDTWIEAWSGEADLLVIGDGFSNLPSQWVQLWARNLGAERPVEIRHWGETSDVEFNDPIVLSDSGEVPLTVWSASRAGSTIQAAAQRYDSFVEASVEPDAVLITMGLSSADEDIPAGLDALVSAIDEDVPVLVAIGPEGLYEEGVADASLKWAQDNNDRVSVVDLRLSAPANPTAEQWARAFQQALDQS